MLVSVSGWLSPKCIDSRAGVDHIVGISDRLPSGAALNGAEAVGKAAEQVGTQFMYRPLVSKNLGRLTVPDQLKSLQL
jgi:hypothetical protein